MPPRAIWSGSLLFGLVNVPVRMFSAIDEKDLHFHLLHRKDDSRIGYEKVCKKEGKPVPDDEIGTAYEIAKGKYVYLEDDDFAAAEPTGYRTFDLSDFVPLEEIDPIYLDRTYYLAPAEGGENVYAVLTRAMDKAGLAAIGTYVMRNKQHLGCLRVRDGVLLLSQLYFADEIRSHEELAPKDVRVKAEELDMAGELIDRYAGSFDIEKYRDTYRESLLEVVKAKQKGRDVHAGTEPSNEEEIPTDLLEALRESVAKHTRDRSGNGRPRKSAAKKSAGKHDGLAGLTKRELVAKAKDSKVKGYSTMDKDELVAALA
jgi:DNA end-binding protein Ku